MADYLPVYKPGEAVPMTASATITGGQLVEVSGNGTVAPTPASGTASTKAVGVAGHDAATNGRVTVYCRGMVQENTASGAITAGDQVGSGAVAGTVKAVAAAAGATTADINIARSVIGIALTTAADTAKVRWMHL